MKCSSKLCKHERDPGFARCTMCRETARATITRRREKRKASNLCLRCGVRPPTSKRYCTECKGLYRDWRRDVKTEVMEHYGTICACCGESHLEFLNIDHINGGGNKHRKEIGRKKAGSSFYHWLKQNGYPEGFRVLCYNCNCSIGHFGYCPHQKGKEVGETSCLDGEGADAASQLSA